MPTRFEFHIIQSFAPSNLNRDDTGSPKDAVFGGVRRGRVSSQCLKRAARLYMRDEGLLPPSSNAYRTKRVTEILAKKLEARAVPTEEAMPAATAALAGIGSQKKMKIKDGKTEYLMFLGDAELEAMADLISPMVSGLKDPKSAAHGEIAHKLTEILKRRGAGASDVALFGRMLANLPDANTDAACQVAHAISTHRVDREFDYYTAVDDMKPDDNSGADMIGTIEFNSSCYYRYSVLDVDQLRTNLGDGAALASDTVAAYARAAIMAEPTGKQNTFAAHNPPSTALVLLRRKGAPRNLANAFERAVAGGNGGLVRASTERLIDMWRATDEMFGRADQAWVLDLTGAFEGTAEALLSRSVDELVEAVRAASV